MNEKQNTPTAPEADSVILPIGLANDILAYLTERPHKEVFNLIAAMQKNAQLVSTKPVVADEPVKEEKVDGKSAE
jgi:hypothetical protein